MTAVHASIPGKIMLAGEYAVLRGGAALACTVSTSMKISVSKADGHSFAASSDLLGKTFTLRDVTPDSELSQEPLVQVMQHLDQDLTETKLHFGVHSDLKVSYGVGSSSALRFGCLLAAQRYVKGEPLTQNECWDAAHLAYEMQRSAQSIASGYDIATQCMGGLTVMRNQGGASQWPGLIARIATGPATLNQYVLPLVGDQGAPTGSLTKATVAWLDQNHLWDELSELSEELVDDFTALMTAPNSEAQLPALIAAVKAHRVFFENSPAACPTIQNMFSKIPGFDREWTCKTSGAGGSDALLLIGKIETLREVAAAAVSHGWHAAPFSFIDRHAAIMEDQ